MQYIPGADFKNNQTTKQEFHQEHHCSLLNNFNWTYRKIETKLYLLPIGPNKTVQQENNNIFDKILVSLFDCF